tara:strand:+ start:103 stop:603 length:501 start_codon:yes stop_codon:yes gene_type:complete
MRKLLVGLILGLTLNGCATQSNYKAELDTWVGATENELVNSWGPPNGLYNKPDGGKILTYQESGSYSLPGYPSTSSSTNMGVTTTVTTVPSDTIIQTGCKTNFYFSPEGRITTWNFQGNSCVSNYKKPDGTPPSNIDDEQVKQLKSLLKAGIMSQKEFDEAMQAIK